jgi:hypothetical protein
MIFFFNNKLTDKIKLYLYKKYIKSHSKFLLELNDSSLLKLLKSFGEQLSGGVYITSYTMNYLKNKNMKFKLDLTEKNSFNKIKSLNTTKSFDFSICYKFNTFLKSKETLDSFLNILNFNSTSNFKFIISFIDYTEISKLKENLLIQNNEIVYYIEKQHEKPIFNTWKIFINGVTNENQLYENTIDYKYLIDYFLSNGYHCIESELYKFHGKVSFNESLRRYCVFEKFENETSLTQTKNLTATFSTEKNSLYYHNIKSLYDIINIINCIDNKIQIDFDDQILTPENFSKILNKIKVYNMYNLYDVYNEFYNVNSKGICFYQSKLNNLNEDEIEIEETNFYIVFYNNMLLLDPCFIQKQITKKERNYIIKEINKKINNNQKIKIKELENYLQLINIKYQNKKQAINILNSI